MDLDDLLEEKKDGNSTPKKSTSTSLINEDEPKSLRTMIDETDFAHSKYRNCISILPAP